MPRFHSFFVLVSLLLTQSRLVAQRVDFAQEVLPILSDKCFHCHGPDAEHRKAKLRLDTKDGAFAALRSGGKAIVPGKAKESEVFRRIASNDPHEKMPPAKANRDLTPQQIDIVRRWIDEGATWGVHWAFVKPQRPDLPTVKNAAWVKNPVDAFILHRLEKEKLKPSPEASRETLLRRVTLDLTGVPPTLAEIDAFLKDKSPTAYEKVVDRLLKSPRYGERMVWDWLDAARYADTNGYQGDSVRTMWPWRDWVIRAFNDNMPFDRFTIEQLAGDLLPNATKEQKLATAFCRNHMINGEGGRIAEENRIDYVMDQAETMGTVWLGLTLNCSRCHDHKYDPISQRDYYQLFAFFNQTPVDGAARGGQTPPILDYTTPDDAEKFTKANDEWNAVAKATDELERKIFPRPDGEPAFNSPKIESVDSTVRQQLRKLPLGRTAADNDALAKYFKKTEPAYAESLTKLAKAKAGRDAIDARRIKVMVMEESAKSRDTFILTRGVYNKPTGTKVSSDVPSILPPLPKGDARNRLTLAQWLVSPDHPLTARVTVNRFWQQFLGTGIVSTTEDFGVQGSPPSHPELLDWLATEFVRTGWDVKALVRTIVTSNAYRQSSRTTPTLQERDPDNRLLARGPRFRMPSAMIRDQALAASGLFVDKLGGPAVKPYQPEGIWEEATFGNQRYVQDKGDSLYRRSVYTFWRRIVGPTMFFDAGARQVCSVKQSRTNTPLHALAVLNDPTYIEAARALAERVLTLDKTNDERIETAFRLVLTRRPTKAELPILRASLDRLRSQYAEDPKSAAKLLKIGESKRDEKIDIVEHAAFAGLCMAIMNLDEALTKE